MHKSIFTAIGLLAFAAFACEKVIDVDLNDSAPQLVVEAVLAAGTQDFTVRVSETTSYFDNDTPTFRDDAEITLFDGNDQALEVPAMGSGVYQRIVNAEPGVSYTLTVRIDEITYTATASVPQPVPIATLEEEFQESTGPFDEGYRLFTRFADAPGQTNYYRQIFFIDGERQTSGADLQLSDDALFDGSSSARLPIFQKIFDPGATVKIIFQHLDRNSFEYLNSLADIVNTEGGGPNSASAAPGNPNSNWDGNILGYFGAVAADTMSIDLPN